MKTTQRTSRLPKIDSRKALAERAEWFETNEPPSIYGPQKFCSREYEVAHDEELALQRFTVEYLRRQFLWRPRSDTTWRDYVVEAASASVYEGLKHLRKLALLGDAKGVERLTGFALNTTEVLDELVNAQFATVQWVAQKQRRWPVLKSLHQHFDSDHKAILLRLEVGKCNPLNIYKGKWNPNDEVGKIAMRIWDQFEYLRSLPYPFGSDHWIEAERIASSLPEFDAKTWPKWFEVAKAFILETHKTPEKIQKLNALVRAKTRKIPSYKIKSTVKISSHFFTMLKDKFRSMAGCNRE